MAGAARHWPLAAALICALMAWKPIVVGPAEQYNTEVLQSAIAVYAVLRGINAALSVAKETEIGVEAFGSFTTQPAMILDPIDETVARVADAVFLLAAASGVLEIAFAPLARMGAILAAAGFLLVYLPVLMPAVATAVISVGRGLASFGLVLGLALPLGYGLGGQLGAVWTEQQLRAAESALDGSASQIEAAFETARAAAEPERADATPAPDERIEADTPREGLGSVVGPLLDRLDRAGDAASDAMAGIAERVGSAGQAVSDAVPDMAEVQARGGEILESSLTIVAIYTFRLLILPLVLLWCIVVLARRAADISAGK